MSTGMVIYSLCGREDGGRRASSCDLRTSPVSIGRLTQRGSEPDMGSKAGVAQRKARSVSTREMGVRFLPPAPICRNCADWRGGGGAKSTGFVIDGLKHYAPDMWLASRAERHGDGVQSVFVAMQDWARHCRALLGE